MRVARDVSWGSAPVVAQRAIESVLGRATRSVRVAGIASRRPWLRVSARYASQLEGREDLRAALQIRPMPFSRPRSSREIVDWCTPASWSRGCSRRASRSHQPTDVGPVHELRRSARASRRGSPRRRSRDRWRSRSPSPRPRCRGWFERDRRRGVRSAASHEKTPMFAPTSKVGQSPSLDRGEIAGEALRLMAGEATRLNARWCFPGRSDRELAGGRS